jgi:hypothetical protein
MDPSESTLAHQHAWSPCRCASPGADVQARVQIWQVLVQMWQIFTCNMLDETETVARAHSHTMRTHQFLSYDFLRMPSSNACPHLIIGVELRPVCALPAVTKHPICSSMVPSITIGHSSQAQKSWRKTCCKRATPHRRSQWRVAKSRTRIHSSQSKAIDVWARTRGMAPLLLSD